MLLVFLLCSLEREGVGSSISQFSLMQDLSHKSEHQNVFAVEAGLLFDYLPYYQIYCSQASVGNLFLAKGCTDRSNNFDKLHIKPHSCGYCPFCYCWIILPWAL